MLGGIPFRWVGILLPIIAYLFPLLAGVLYSIPLFPAGFRYRRLKDVTGVKSLTVAVRWSIATVVTPLFCARAPWCVGIAAAMLWEFAREVVNSVYFDMADLPGDRAEGVVTIPVAFGHATTRKWLHALNLLAGIALFGATVAGYLPRRLMSST